MKSAYRILSLLVLLFSASSVLLPGHAATTTASVINSGVYSTRPWLTEKHVYSSTGVPSTGTLVEIQNAILSNVANGAASGDCNDSSDTPPAPSGTWCDSTADANDGTGTVHVEIDQVYKYLGIAPADWPPDGAVVNIIGYTFYDGEGGGTPTNPAPGGWEIHPVTAWNLSNSSSRTFILTISSSSGGSTNPSPGSYAEASGSVVTVTAVPSAGYTFSNFTVDGLVSTANPIAMTMNTNRVVDASFVPNNLTTRGNSPPSLSVPTSMTITAGSTVVFVVNSTEPDIGERVMLTIAGLPPGALFDQSSGRFSWTPSQAEVGTYELTFTGTDNGSPPASSVKSVVIYVVPASSPPPPSSQHPSSQGICFQCLLTPQASSVWLVALTGLVGIVTVVGVIYMKARANLRNVRRMRRLARRELASRSL